MKKKRIGNPLLKRIPRELLGDWKKYLMVALLLVFSIGFVSGMYIANDSMLKSIADGNAKNKLEYGHFELKEAADDALLANIASGEKADVKRYYEEKAQRELDEKFQDEFDKEFNEKFDEEFDSEFTKKFDEEFNAKFDEEFDTAFKKEFDGEFDSAFKKEFDPQFKAGFEAEFDASFDKGFAKTFQEQVKAGMMAQGMTSAQADAALPAAVDAAKQDGTYDAAYKGAYTGAYKEAYDGAYPAAYKEAYDAAYPEAYKEAHDSAREEAYTKAYKEAFEDAYPEAREEAYDEAYTEAYDEAYADAQKEIQEEIDTKYAEAEEKYELNDPEFQTVPVNLYELFYKNGTEDHNGDGAEDGGIRLYVKNDDIDMASVLEGRLPENAGEIAIDRMHADNVKVKVGDTIAVSGQSYEVVGLIAYVNYATLHEHNTDFMFDALKFNVAMVTEDGFAKVPEDVHYGYAWTYKNTPADESAEKAMSDDFLKVLLTQVVVADNEIEDYVPRYGNSAVNFAVDDMVSDKSMGGVILDILIVIIAFIFAVTIRNTITKESSTIGTLRASGYTKGELIRHYLAMPTIVTILAAIIGNVLGYVAFVNVVVKMYYNSYSLPEFQLHWNSEAFVQTTIVPLILMLLVNSVIIIRTMQHSPLQFLRHDLKKHKRSKALRLPRWSFMKRFGLRIMLQNIPDYCILFAGIFFVALMLAMAVGMPSTLNHYIADAGNMMYAKNQYILKDYEDEDGEIIQTANPDAEAFNVNELLYKAASLDETISVYGLQPDSRYIVTGDLSNLGKEEVYISKSFHEKYGVDAGEDVVLHEKYENKSYTFHVKEVTSAEQSLAVYTSRENFAALFDVDEEAFNGFFSATEITDIDEDYIATVVTERDITKMAEQLNHSMGSMMAYFQYLCIGISAILLYLLTKLIVEKNEIPISMVKILGYNDGEIGKLYLHSTTLVVVLVTAVSAILAATAMEKIWEMMMKGYTGWFTFYMDSFVLVRIFALIFAGYLLVLIFDYRRIRRIPLDEALKNVE